MNRLRILLCLAKEKVPNVKSLEEKVPNVKSLEEKVPNVKSLEYKSRRFLSHRTPPSEGDFASTEERSHDAGTVEVAVSANIMCSATIATSAFKPAVSHLLSKVYVPRQLLPWARPATKPK
jgi:hypothetical protein